MLSLELEKENLVCVAPPPALCTDNGAMIAWAGIESLNHGVEPESTFEPRARWPLAELSSIGEGQGATT